MFAENATILRNIMDQPLYLFTGLHVDIELQKRSGVMTVIKFIASETLIEAWEAACEASRTHG